MPEDLARTAGPLAATTAEPTVAPPASPPGYELCDEIGHGGMGVVYRARDTALDRDVALKLLSERYPAGSPAAQRFLSEARITGQLQHPGIPAVHQVGTLADGRPFLAMKLIKGSTLEAILKQRSDSSTERGRLLAIFEAICQAVGYAHAHRVIHRDLKPANVMVGAFGEVQVMDWGLAKVLGDATPATAEALAAEQTQAWTQLSPTPESGSHTQAGSLIGTPAFIPPEQAGGEIERVNERADVFGLGALLSVILTGKPPYVGETFESVRVQALRGKLDDCFARLEGCEAEPELVALCKKCLAFEPADRPADAGAVATAVAGLRAAADERARQAELDRVQAEGERREALARTTEQRRRRRILLAASGMIALALLAGLSVSLWQTRRAEQALEAEQQARQDEKKARQQAFAALRSMTADVIERKFAQAVLTEDDREFLRGVIAQFDAFAAIKEDDADSRAVRAEGRLRVGTMHVRLGEHQEAEQDYSQALNIYQQLAADLPQYHEFRHGVARSHDSRGSLFKETGRLKEAEEDYTQALSIFQQQLAGFPSQAWFRQGLAVLYNNRGSVLIDMGRLKEAEEDCNEALSIYQRLVANFPQYPEFRQDLARSLNNRGVLLYKTGRLKEAEADYNQAMSIQVKLAADFPNKPDLGNELAGTHVNLAILSLHQGNWAAAKDTVLNSFPILCPFVDLPEPDDRPQGERDGPVSCCDRAEDETVLRLALGEGPPPLRRH